MKELSLHILDIGENAIRAGATRLAITIREDRRRLLLTVTDDGCGMEDDALGAVTDPFFTTRTTRRVGLGVPLLKQAAEQTGGTFSISSRPASRFPCDHGTTVTASFCLDAIDCAPLGDIVATVVALIQGAPETELQFLHEWDKGRAALNTAELRRVLGPEVSLHSNEVILWIAGYLREQYGEPDQEANSQKGRLQ